MAKKTVDREDLKQPEPKREVEQQPALIPPHYAQRDFSQVAGKQIFTQKKGDIIRDQQKLVLYKNQNAPIALFDESMIAKCPNPKCGHVFAWEGGKQEA